MTIYKWVIGHLKKYSFVDNVTMKNAVVTIYYKKDGKVKTKKLPYRATKDQLVDCIEKIKEDINFYEERAQRVKGLQPKVTDNEFVIGFTNK